MNEKIKVPVEVSARHCHLSKEVLDAVFGAGYQLTKIKQLSQPRDFACKETVLVIAGSKEFKNVRVVGPLRAQTQVEISLTDAFGLDTVPPVNLSGNLDGSGAFTIIGPAGQVELKEGLIIVKRHLHCSTDEAQKMGLKSGKEVAVKIEGERQIIFEKVTVRVSDDYKLCLHLDTDEGNSAGINKIGEGQIVL